MVLGYTKKKARVESKGGVIKFLLVILKYPLSYIDINVFNPQGFV